MRYSYVIPCYRSEKTIKAVVDELIEQNKTEHIDDYEIILVNDCSPDNVWSVIAEMALNNPDIKAVNLAKNFGQHAALLAGYARVTGDYVVSLDDDGQAPIDELGKLIAKIEQDYDVVYAYYEEIKQKKYRKMGTSVATKMSIKMLGAPEDFKGSSFYIAKRFVINEMIKYNNPYPYLLGLVLRVTKKIGYVETKHRARLEGRSGYSFKSLVSLWMNGFTAFSVKPLEISTMIGFFTALLGFIFGLVTVIRKIVNPDIIAGWSSVISILLLVGGMVLLVLGMIGEYVGRIYICINEAPQYVVREEINISNTDEVKDEVSKM